MNVPNMQADGQLPHERYRDATYDGVRDHKDQSLSSDEYRDASPSSEGKVYQDWTDSEERKLVFKLDAIIMTILTVCFFCMQMDRGNIGNALTDGFLKDVGIDQANYNVGQQLLYVGIVVLEIPSNIILYRVGPRWWMGGQIIAWGLVELFQAFQKGLASFYVTRLLLGLCEAGFIPASLYVLSMWYKRAETSKRFAIFYFGNLVAQGATSLLAYGILRMRGISGLGGWQWMFILEGIFTILMGFVLIAFLPQDPTNPYPVLRLNYFTPRERDIMYRRVILDDPSKVKKATHVSASEFFHVLGNWRIYPHLLVSMCGISAVSTWLQYAPKLVQMTYPKLKANAMVSIGGWLQIPVSLALGIFADVTKKRGIALLVGILFVWGLVIGDLVVAGSKNKILEFGILITTLSFSSTWQPINGSWLSINCVTPAERSVTLAMFVMFTNIGGIFGSQLFQPSDKKSGYKTGWSAILGLWTVSLVSVIFLNIMYRVYNKKRSTRVVGGQDIVNGQRVRFWL